MRLAVLILLTLSAGVTYAEPEKPSNQVTRMGPYLGVQPGTIDRAPGKGKLRSRGAIRLVSWIGFEMTTTPGGRVFIQTTEPPAYDIVPSEPNEVVLELTNSRLHSRNESRPLDTSGFPTVVESVTAKQRRGNKTRVTIKLRQVVGYDLKQEGNYLFLDFRPPVRPLQIKEKALDSK
ncbi:MAG: AMIN domain-containing protein [Myxococcota bacterium]|nr:AMIN domain-containing protein [Myxococcota bacterium]